MAADDKPDRVGDLVVKVATALGANESKMRWRVQRFRNRRIVAARRSERRAQHVGYEHKKCPSCRAINDKNDKICSQCGGALSWRVTQMIRRAGFGGIVTGRALIIAALVGAYVTILGTQTGTLEVRELIVRWAAKSFLVDGELWELVSALAINPGLMGVVAVSLGLFLIGSEIEALYGRFVTIGLFMLTGTIGVVAHHLLFADSVSLGAAPGLAGLIGIGIGAGHAARSIPGRELRNMMVKWAICILALLLLLTGNIVPEVAALLAGLGIGVAVQPARLSSTPARIIVGSAGVLALAAAVATAINALAIF